MARKSVGYVKLFWNCPNCGTQNPGPQKTCSGCGAPQPDDVVFVQGDQQKIIEDEAEIEKAKKGPDIHCPFCGARNPADAKNCSQCGGDIEEGFRRSKGTVIGAYKKPAENIPDISCPHCGASNPGTATNCSQCGGLLKTSAPYSSPQTSGAKQETKKKFNVLWLILGIMAFCIFGVAAFLIISNLSTKSASGTVNAVHWERSIEIEELQEVTKNDWEEDIPMGATVLDCDLEYHHSQDEPTANATEVCGDEYVEDTGTGHGEVVQDCEYRVYEKKCDYLVEEYVVVDEVIAEGNDLDPYWPEPDLAYGEVEGADRETYIIVFNTDGKTMEYQTSDAQLFSRCTNGSKWTLNINAFGDIVSIE